MMRPTRRHFLLVTAGASGLAGLALGDWLRETSGGMPRAEERPAENGLFAARRNSLALGCEVSMLALHRRAGAAAAALDAAFDELERVERVMSIYRPESQLSRLNRTGALDTPHPYLVQVLEAAQATSQRSAGAFDVTVQPLWAVYARAGARGEQPSEREVAEARRKVDWRKLEVSASRVRLAEPGMAVTLNGIAQGFAADRALEALRRAGVEGALVNTGELGTLGRKAGGEAWTVGIQHPRQADAYVELARLEGRCLATSGDYATTFSPDRANNHIFDPSTGRSPEGFSSVSVVADLGLTADALSTALFVLPLDRGAELLKAHPGVEAFFVKKDGTALGTRGFPRAS
ncbi:MAG: FAD:protein FMN transferase [Planctomycetota bacterium]|nr:FAD:protein FMN transferase [Planctomycetota bacterium]